jgi:DNA-binding beta-propeller fold protein YncE
LYFLLTYDGHGYLDEVDCATLDVISRTRLGENHAVLELDPGRCRVMCGGDGMWLRGAELTVFDCKSDSLRMRAVVPLCGWYTLPRQRVLCHNPVSRKFYYRWGSSAGGLGVIDEQTNKVVRRVILPQWISQSDLVYCRTGNKLYCGSDPGVAVVDGAGDSLLKFVNLVDNTAQNLAWCPDYNKLYCTGNGGLRWYMAVMDCYTDSVIKEIEFYDFPGRPVYISRGRLLYSYGHRLALIDCRNDSVLVDTNMGSNVDAVGHTGDGKKVYVVHAGRVEVLDGSSLSLLATIDWTYGAPRGYNSFLMCSDTTDKLYWFVVGGGGVEPDSVLAIDTHTDTVVARLGAGYGQEQGCFDYSGRYIFNLDGTFAPDPWDNSLIIYDTQLDSVAAVYKDLPAAPLAAVPNPEERCIYVACSDVILVYPDAPPGIEETPNAEVRATRSGPTVVRGTLNLQPAIYSLQSETALLSVDGRKVLDLKPGANDIRALAPGVYFVREAQAQAQAQAIRKVVKLK